MLGMIASLDASHAKAAHAWVQYLKTMLELHLCIFDSPSMRPARLPAPLSGMRPDAALATVLERPPMHLTMQEVGLLDKMTTQSALGWVKQLLTMLELQSSSAGAPFALVDTAADNGPNFDARSGGKAR